MNTFSKYDKTIFVWNNTKDIDLDTKQNRFQIIFFMNDATNIYIYGVYMRHKYIICVCVCNIFILKLSIQDLYLTKSRLSVLRIITFCKIKFISPLFQ